MQTLSICAIGDVCVYLRVRVCLCPFMYIHEILNINILFGNCIFMLYYFEHD